jgi:hypothetical protein
MYYCVYVVYLLVGCNKLKLKLKDLLNFGQCLRDDRSRIVLALCHSQWTDVSCVLFLLFNWIKDCRRRWVDSDHHESRVTCPMVPDALTVIRIRRSRQDVAGLVVVSNRRNVRHHPLLRFGAAPVDVTVCHSYCGDRRTRPDLSASLSHLARALDSVELSMWRRGKWRIDVRKDSTTCVLREFDAILLYILNIFQFRTFFVAYI